MNYPTLPPQTVDALIGFRVECHDPTNNFFSRHLMDDEGDILPDTFPSPGLVWEQADAHMSWSHTDSPFVSFFRSWRRAMNWRRSLIRRGGRGIRIIAVWLKGLPKVYDAYDIALRLGYSSLPTGGPGIRRRLENHEDELLVEGGIDGYSYRVLACFDGDTLDNEVTTLSPLVNHQDKLYRPTIPRGSLLRMSGVTATEMLNSKIHGLTGVRDEFKLYILVLKMSGRDFTWEREPDGITKVKETLTVSNNGMGFVIGHFIIDFVRG